MNRKIVCVVLTLGLVGFVAGCSSYYKVTDPGSSKVYYTDDLDHKDSGSVVFEDANTGNKITLQNSDVQEISKKEFKANTPYR